MYTILFLLIMSPLWALAAESFVKPVKKRTPTLSAQEYGYDILEQMNLFATIGSYTASIQLLESQALEQMLTDGKNFIFSQEQLRHCKAQHEKITAAGKQYLQELKVMNDMLLAYRKKS